MGDKTIIGYLILAVREAKLNVKTEEKLVEAMRKVMEEHLPSDALELYMDWIKYDLEELM